ncbi:MAG TPA: hypothetical protein VF260_01790 [Bacilli bacterium]
MNIRAMLGAVLILFGVYLYVNGHAVIDTGTLFGVFWASFFVIPVGLFFHWLYFGVIRKGVGLLIPGGIILLTGIVCQIATLLDGWSYLWPGFIFAVAGGLFEFYWFGSRNKWLMIPISILTALSVFFFAIFSLGAFLSRVSGQPVIAIAFVFVGALLLIVRKRPNHI